MRYKLLWIVPHRKGGLSSSISHKVVHKVTVKPKMVLHTYFGNLIHVFWIFILTISNIHLTQNLISRYELSWWITLRRSLKEVIELNYWLTKLQPCKIVHFTSRNSLSVFVELFGWKMPSSCKYFNHILFLNYSSYPSMWEQMCSLSGMFESLFDLLLLLLYFKINLVNISH